jgi:uncharacterized protein
MTNATVCTGEFTMTQTYSSFPTDLSVNEATREALEAAAFRRLLTHLRQRTDVQNIDMMGYTGFCRNCLGDWLHEEAAARGLTISKEDGRAHVYGMPSAEFKAKYQKPATDEQMARMDASLVINKQVRGEA